MPLVLNLPTWLHGYPTATRHSASYKPKATYRTPTSSCPLPSLYTARFPLIGFEAVDSLPMLADPAALHVALVLPDALPVLGRPDGVTLALALAFFFYLGGGLPSGIVLVLPSP